MKINLHQNYQELSKATAQLVIAYIKEKKNSLVCIASGHTPIGVFTELAKEVKANTIDLTQCTFLSLDEWVGIDPTDSGSCLSMLKRDCFGPLQLTENQTVYFNVSATDLNQECERINNLIVANGGLDIMLVGVGTNGHIGMNEPGTSFESYAHISTLAEETKTVGQKYFDKPTKLNFGITLGLRHLQEAKLPIVMASGEKKAAILAKGLTEPITEKIPVSIAQRIPQCYVMLDLEAAQNLKAKTTSH
jgi:glucosamine-6-phosphate isomerase